VRKPKITPMLFHNVRPWVVHNNPQYIEIEGWAMKKAITAVECWGYDVFDIAIRRVQQLDRGMYPASIIYRLLLESDFAVSSLRTPK
jgi:hypothetical protein